MIERIITLRTALDDYYCPPRVIRQKTYKRYVSDCNRWEKYTDNPDIRGINTNLILDYRKKLIEEKKSVNTINPNLKTIFYILTACIKAGVIKEVPDFGVPLQQVKPSPTPIPFEDLERFMENVQVAQWPLDPEYWIRYTAFIYLTGLRRGDLLDIHRQHCTEKKIEFTASKTGKTHIFPMPVWLWRKIEPLPPGQLFPINPKQIYQEMRRICKAAGIEYFSPKKLRILSVNEWESAWPACGAVVQGAAIKGWTEATESYMTTHGLLFKGIHRLRIPRPLMTSDELDKEQSDRIRWQRMFEELPANTRDHILGLGENMLQG